MLIPKLGRKYYSFIFLMGSLLFLTSPVLATIAFQAGADQRVLTGMESKEIVVKISDDTGNPTSGATVNFSVTDATGRVVANSLTTATSQTKGEGLASTYFKATSVVGTYTITAILATATSQFVQTTLIVVIPSPANILVTAGAGQQVVIGSESKEVTFQVLDEMGQPLTGIAVNFSVVAPGGSPIDGLGVKSAVTANQGLATTRLKATNKIGNYIITAMVASDVSQYVNVNVMVIAGSPTKLIVTAGDNQIIPAGKPAESIYFRLTDAFDNTIANEVIAFTVITPSGQNSGLNPNSATTNLNGIVSTRLEQTDIQGNYTITATLVKNTTVTISAILQVAPPIPQLPSLGFAGAFNPLGEWVNTTAIFHGGISSDGKRFEQESILNTTASCTIKAFIQVDSNHVGQTADILIVVVYTPPLWKSGLIVMLDTQSRVQTWDGEIAHLLPFQENVVLPQLQVVNIYQGGLPAGELRLFIGYRLHSGLIVFNATQTINAVIY